jgi:hypothetical protein
MTAVLRNPRYPDRALSKVEAKRRDLLYGAGILHSGETESMTQGGAYDAGRRSH